MGQRSAIECIQNASHPASLKLRKLYQVLADPGAAALGQLRVIDESGEDYLYPRFYFAAVELSKPAEPS